MVMVWNFELYMLPLTLIVILMWCLVVIEIKGGSDAKEKMAFVSTCHFTTKFNRDTSIDKIHVIKM